MIDPQRNKFRNVADETLTIARRIRGQCPDTRYIELPECA